MIRSGERTGGPSLHRVGSGDDGVPFVRSREPGWREVLHGVRHAARRTRSCGSRGAQSHHLLVLRPDRVHRHLGVRLRQPSRTRKRTGVRNPQRLRQEGLRLWKGRPMPLHKPFRVTPRRSTSQARTKLYSSSSGSTTGHPDLPRAIGYVPYSSTASTMARTFSAGTSFITVWTEPTM